MREKKSEQHKNRGKVGTTQRALKANKPWMLRLIFAAKTDLNAIKKEIKSLDKFLLKYLFFST